MQRAVFVLISLCTTAGILHAAGPVDVKAFHREGQTFLTWQEDNSVKGETYRIYRDAKKITSGSLGRLKPIAEVREGSSRFEEMWTSDGKGLLTGRDGTSPPWVIPRLCIEPVGQDNKPNMLPENTGLLVWTPKEEKEQSSYYAVTIAANGQELKKADEENTCGPVKEQKAPIGTVHYYTSTDNRGNQRDWYIMWMGYELWNPDYIGYAFPFALTTKAFKEGGNTPRAHLDGIGTMNVFTANYTDYGCGDFSKNALPTWYYGYGTTVKNRASGLDVKQPVANYVQYRIMQTVLWSRRKYNITDPRFVIWGNSMGASGCIGFALAFPKFVTAIWSNEGITDYANPRKADGGLMWTSSMWGNYGKPELANPARLLPFGDERLDWYLKHDGMNVFDFRNVAKFLELNVAEDFPLLLIGHCHQDGSIPAHTQAYPFEQYIRNSRHCFSYTIAKGGHGWGSAWKGCPMEDHVRWDESRPGFSNVPCITGWRYNKKDESSRTYMYKVAWGVESRKVKGKTVQETETSWSMPLIHEARPGQEEDYFVDVTPRNLQKLEVSEGDQFTFRILDINGGPIQIAFDDFHAGDEMKARFKDSGATTADEHNLLLIPCVPIRKEGCVVEVGVKSRAGKPRQTSRSRR